MRGPPDPPTNKAALQGRLVRNSDIHTSNDNTETVREFQAASLRRRFALGYYFATTVAQLAWGALPR